MCTCDCVLLVSIRYTCTHLLYFLVIQDKCVVDKPDQLVSAEGVHVV